MRYVAQKVGFYAVALFAALTLNFFIPRLLPGDPVDILLAKMQQKGPVSEATVTSLRLLLGSDSDEPLFSQYVQYLGNLARGDLGISVSYFPAGVSTIIGQAIPWTIALIGIATILSFVFGVGLGTLAGWKRGSVLDNFIPVTTMFQAVPYFWLALILLYVFGSVLRVFPLSGGYNVYEATPGLNWTFVQSAVLYGTLPALTIIISSVGGWLLGMRNMMVSTLSEDYIVTAEAKGLSPMRIRQSYAARNAVLPQFAGFAISLGFVVSGSIVTEQVFSYPGIGNALFTATQNNDYALMQGIFLVITLAVLGTNFIVDLMYGFIDPRTRAKR
ncbi:MULTISPECIES: ABC transporter permease [unclassified Frigoribacterium]|jgi:peptide/nickel transport system permease protein|uniref:ABC transporter permease n=1 Tax=unclassified Frigoribacterium TaxID=2627005 RepID=UPI000F46A4D0|nr:MULTISPECIES: ABC transporter permease [unclassified Frigoribacterium]MBD8538913.1 ABC transporter permease [Frigoribacterium sp. CFBP 8751]MBD8140032.1 ABC transporter permease [Frigoribacterium sp. CFBP 13605]MBD8485224.1 ABC transporter permease [Frigoribacterium sp. CFBP 8759]NQW86339.1 ABC transporter permease [Frigoribacterium sp. VKM Ac-2860]NQX07671.1 ABC transporter permease [Frigoribacterium sp. VKM Ac-2859]